MAKYGKLDASPPPDVSQELAALKDLLAKEEITREKYNLEVSKLQQIRMNHLVSTNGRFVPGRRIMKQVNEFFQSMNERKRISEARKQVEDRNEFVEAVKKQKEETAENS